MAMLNDEVAIIKAQSIKLDDDKLLVVTGQYHTEKDPQTGKTSRAKSKYRWLARVFTTDEVKKLVEHLSSDEHRLEKWRWPNDPDPWYICLANESAGFAVAKFFENKLKKAHDWEMGQKFLNGWQTQTSTREAGYNTSAQYPMDFTAENGDKVSLSDKKALLEHIGQNLYHDQIMKSKLPPPAKAHKA